MTALFKTGPRAGAARAIRGLGARIWDAAKLNDIRLLSELDLAVIQFVGALDRFANALDRPY